MLVRDSANTLANALRRLRQTRSVRIYSLLSLFGHEKLNAIITD